VEATVGDQPTRRLGTGRMDGDVIARGRDSAHRPSGLVRERRADGDSDNDGQCSGNGDQPPAQHDRLSLAYDRAERNWPVVKLIERAAQAGAQVPLVDTHLVLHSASSALTLSLDRARELWLLTFPIEQPRLSAT